jgi:hypothetical protein
VIPALRIAVALLGMALASAAGAVQPPRNLSASYNVYLNGAHVAVVNETYEARSSSYRIVSESVPLGALALLQKPAKVVSHGRLTRQGLRPERFEGRSMGRGQVLAEFDWAAERLSFGRDGKLETVALPSGIDLAMTDGRRLQHYHYAVTRGVEIETPLGRLGTVHLVRQTGPDASGNENEIWLAPGLHFLPVKMVIREDNGTRYEQLATRIEVPK